MEQRNDTEDDHAHDKHDQEKSRPAARMKRAGAADRRDVKRPARLECVDRLVLRTVVLEDSPHIRQQRDRGQIAEHQADANQPLDQHESKASRAMDGEVGQKQRQSDEQDERKHACGRDRAGDLLLADHHVVGAGVHVGRPDERLHAEVQLLADERQPTHKR